MVLNLVMTKVKVLLNLMDNMGKLELNNITEEEVAKDINLILWSTRLSGIYRFTHQRFWEKETLDLEHALRIDGYNDTPRAESVAEHSWHIADIALTIAPRFNGLDIGRCIMLAILHDKLEIFTGDKNPVGKNGKGTTTHAFNEQSKVLKDEKEKDALRKYKNKLKPICANNSGRYFVGCYRTNKY